MTCTVMLHFRHLHVFLGIIITITWLHEWLSCLMGCHSVKDKFKVSRLLFEVVLFVFLGIIITVTWLHQWLSCRMGCHSVKDIYKVSRLLFEVVFRSKQQKYVILSCFHNLVYMIQLEIIGQIPRYIEA